MSTVMGTPEGTKLSIEQIDDCDRILKDEVGALSKVNGGKNATDDSVAAEVCGNKIREELRRLRELIVLYEWYNSRLG
jgi:hypothetical protein